MAKCDWRPAAAAVVLYLLCDVIGSALGGRCNNNGCCSENKYTKWTCNFSGSSKDVTLPRQRKLKDAKITHGQNVSLKSNALASSNKLGSLLFTDIQRLNVESSSKIQVIANRNVSLTVRRIGDLHFKTKAFFGWRSDLATLSIRDTETVHIDKDAFPKSSNFQRVKFFNITTLTLETRAIFSKIGRLELENITTLTLSREAIRGAIGTLYMRNVSTESCPPQAIGGAIGLVSLRLVKLLDVESRCLDAGLGWNNLTIADSRLGHLSRRSIHGSIVNISISGCLLASAGPAAVSVTTGRLSISNSTVGELGPLSLQVEAAVSVTLRRVNVSYLRQDALSGLQVTDTSSSSSGISVSGLTVQRADPGSLRFADGAPVTLTDLQLTGGCICSTPSWARQLLLGPSGGGGESSFGGGEDGPPSKESDSFSGGKEGTSDDRDSLPSSGGLTEKRGTLLRQIEAGLCTAGGGSVSLADFTVRRCGASAGASGLSGQPTDRSAPLASGWSYLEVVLLAALLLAVTALLVTAAARYRRHRLKQRPERLEMTGAGEVGLCSADGPAAGGQQREDNPSHRPVLPNGPTDQEPEALYSEVADLPNGTTNQEPEALYSEVAGHLSDDSHRTVERSPPVGESQRKPLNSISSRAVGCFCSTTALYAVSATTERCSCKPAQLTDSEPATSYIPGGGMRDEPTADASPDYDDALWPPGHPITELSTDRAGGERGNPTGHAALGYADDLPDYAEIPLEPAGDPRPTECTDYMIDNQLYGSTG